MTGETVAGGSPAAADLDEKVLTEAVRRGLITAVQGAAALEEARSKGVPLHQVLRDRGLVAHDAARDLDEEVKEDFVPGYRVLEKLGEGGMGVVYKALQKRLDRVVALKVVIPRLASDPSFLRRFEREAKAAARLNHPTIVAAYDYGESNGRVFLAMEFVEGVNCADWMRKNGLMAEDRALALARDVAAGLSHAQAAGIIHRDIKPANILIADRRPGATTSGSTESGAKVTDLGLARTGDAAPGATELTAAGVILGTPGYMSPEQAFGEKVDHRADIYALGSTLYQLLTGRRPFEATTPLAVISKQQVERLPDPRDHRPELTAGVVELLQGMLSRQAETRYPGYRELLADLDAVRAGGMPSLPPPPEDHRSIARPSSLNPTASLPATIALHALPGPRAEAAASLAAPPTILQGAAPSAPPVPPPPAPPPPRASRLPLFLAAVGVVAVAVLAVAAFSGREKHGDHDPPAPPAPTAPTAPSAGPELEALLAEAAGDLDRGDLLSAVLKLKSLRDRMEALPQDRRQALGEPFTRRLHETSGKARDAVEADVQEMVDDGEYDRARDRVKWFQAQVGPEAAARLKPTSERLERIGDRGRQQREAFQRAAEARQRGDAGGVLESLEGFEERFEFASPKAKRQAAALRSWAEAERKKVPERAPDPEPAVRLVPDGDPVPLWTGASLGAWAPVGGQWGVSDPGRTGWFEGAERPEPASHLRGQREALGRARLDISRRVKDAAGWRLEWQMLGEARRPGDAVRTELHFAHRAEGSTFVLGVDGTDAYLGVRDAAGTLVRTRTAAGVAPGVRHSFVVENHGDVLVAAVDGKRLGAVKAPADPAPGAAIEAAVEGGVGYFSDVLLLRLRRP